MNVNKTSKTKIGKTTYIVKSIFDKNAKDDLANKLYNKFKQADNNLRLYWIYLPSNDSDTQD
jgi:hypothetical protein